MNLVSFDLKGNFGFFRKPETNNTLNVSYNMLHKPALLGLLGAIIGLKGYQKKGELPEYYQKLSKIKVGIEPLNHDKGNFTKTPIKYSNTVGYGNKGTTFLTEELTLISPQYRVFLLLDIDKQEQEQLLENLKGCRTEFIPYFGKNEFTVWWDKDSFKVYDFQQAELQEDQSIPIQNVFLKNQVIAENSEKPEVDFFSAANDDTELPFMYFERLPTRFNEELMQYELSEMVFSNCVIKNAHNIPDLYHLTNENGYVQLH